MVLQKNGISEAINKAARDTVGEMMKNSRRGKLGVKNEELADAIRHKKEAYKKYLQSRKEETGRYEYYSMKNTAKSVVRKGHQELQRSQVEHDKNGTQQFAYKPMKILQKEGQKHI